MRIKLKGSKFYVMIGIDIPDTPVLYKLSNGAIGVDTNPDGLGTVEVNREGNIISHEYLYSQRLPFAKHDKRQHDIEALALQVVNKAILANKGIVIEDLKFNDGKHGSRKFNRKIGRAHV